MVLIVSHIYTMSGDGVIIQHFSSTDQPLIQEFIWVVFIIIFEILRSCKYSHKRTCVIAPHNKTFIPLMEIRPKFQLLGIL